MYFIGFLKWVLGRSESFNAAKRNLNRRRGVSEDAPRRRSERLSRAVVESQDDLVNVEDGEESGEHGQASEDATTDYASEGTVISQNRRV